MLNKINHGERKAINLIVSIWSLAIPIDKWKCDQKHSDCSFFSIKSKHGTNKNIIKNISAIFITRCNNWLWR
jgi:hypothetical protein